MRAKDVKIRCSALGLIMTNPRSKSETLSKTAQSYIEELFMELEYGVVFKVSTPATRKGNDVEPDSLAFANKMMSLGLTDEELQDNTQIYRHNDYVHGSSDLETNELVIDVKNPFTIKNFPMFCREIPNKHYLDQMQGYLWLSGKQKGAVVYTAMPSPDEIIYDAIRREHWVEMPFWNGDENEAIVEEVTNAHTFPDVEEENRIRIWEVERSEERIEQIKERIELCRDYYNQLLIMNNRPDAVKMEEAV